MIKTAYRIITNIVNPFAPLLMRLLVREDPVERSQRLGDYDGSFDRQGIWVHAASAGEMEGAEPIVRELAKRSPGRPVVISAMTRTGRKRSARIGGTRSIFTPVDLPGPVRKAFDQVDPALLILVETEIWPTLLGEAARRKIPVAIVNGRLSGGAYQRMKTVRSLYRDCLKGIAFVGVQRLIDAERFRHFGVQPGRIHVHGSTKIDAIRQGEPELPLRRQEGERWIVFGSVRRAEEEAVREAALRVLAEREEARVVIAPRHPEKAGPLPDDPRGEWHRFSERPIPDGCRGIWVDTVGDLISFYALADVAFVGGSLSPHGGHNPAEPARFAVPVLFGPHLDNCREFADLLLDAGAASVVRSGTELAGEILSLLADEETRRKRGEAGREAIDSRRGAAGRAVDLLEKAALLPAAVGETS